MVWIGKRTPVLTIYKEFKVSFEYEHYLDLLPSHLRCLVSRLRLSILPVCVQTGPCAINRIPRNERYCLFGETSDIDDEYNCKYVCPNLNHTRKRYINVYYYHSPSDFKYLELVKSYDKSTLFGLANFVREALRHRNNLQLPPLINR